MRVFHGVGEVPAGFGPSAVTIGKFDGLHQGHRAVIGDLLAAAGDVLVPTVVTFDRNPLELLRPEACPPPLVGPGQKLELLESAGVAAVLVLAFDAARAAQEPEAFVREVLVDALHVRRLLVGDDFRFGRGGRGDIALLTRMGAEHGFVVEVQQQIETAARRVSSTWIRELLSAGAIEEAANLLGRPPAVRGVVVHGAHRGRELGYPTANLAQESDGMIPADGVYAGRLDRRQRRRRLPGRDLGRQQPDVRGRAAEAGGGLRARPHARPLRPRRRRRLHAPHPRADRLRGRSSR